MIERKIGILVYRKNLSPILSIFRLTPEKGSKFPTYKAGQYIALRREDCKFTKRVIGADGQPDYVPDLDELGNQKRGPVTHSYSISSAPFATILEGYLEFYIILVKDSRGAPGRLTESLFRTNPKDDDKVTYIYRITGDFTLDKRAAGFQSVLLLGTGTGLAPFASMIKQLQFEASQGKTHKVKYTLIHTNRTYEELGYHEKLLAIEASQRFDFIYIPSVSRPTPRDLNDPKMGKGRANNLLRYILEMPLREEQDLQEAVSKEHVSRAKAALERTVRPVLPQHVSRKMLLERFDPSRTVILTCGNPSFMADIQHIADANRIRFEKEDW
jgi:ferredoxin-NADP reductase